MNKKIVSAASVLIFLVLLASSLTFDNPVRASSSVIRVLPGSVTIQAAINAANPGDTILVAPGTYYEHIVVNKTLSLIGENKETTIIDGNRTDIVVKITASNVNFTGFTVRRSGQTWMNSGIFLNFGSSNNKISDNIVTQNYHGIFLKSSAGHVISSNNISFNTGRGINLRSSSGNTICANSISQNDNGIELFDSTSNVITANTISDNGWAGIHLRQSSKNIITSNAMSINSEAGIYMEESSNNTFFHNNFMDNGLGAEGQVYSFFSWNTWDNGAEGNYWSDYKGVDLNGDGIGDTNIPHLGVDSLPLIQPWNSLRIFTIDGNVVSILSNSTFIAGFNFSQSLAQISFNVTGASGTLGFCNVTIPKVLLNASYPKIWTATLDGTYLSFTPTENDTHTSLYFTYAHSSHKVQIKVVEIPNVPPTADFTYSPTDPTLYDTINFNDTSFDPDGNITAWNWDFGDGSNSTLQNPTHKYAIGGTFTVTLKVKDNRTTETVTSKAVPVRKMKTTLTVDAPSSVDQGELFTITATLKDENNDPVPNVTIEVYLLRERWENIGSDQTNASGIASITYTPLLALGAHHFKAVFNGTQILAESSSTFITEIIEVVDVEPPKANAGQDRTVNMGETVIFDASGSTDNVGIVSYEWDFGDGTTETGITKNHTYTSPRKYNVTLTVRDLVGNTDTDSITVTVLSTEAFPIWMLGAIGAAVVAIGIAVVTTFLWKNRKIDHKPS